MPPRRSRNSLPAAGARARSRCSTPSPANWGLAGPPEPHDVADALGIALCHYFASNNGRTIMGGARSATFTGVNMNALLGNDPDDLTEDKDDDAEDHRSESA